jgi:hypothetical protein
MGKAFEKLDGRIAIDSRRKRRRAFASAVLVSGV